MTIDDELACDITGLCEAVETESTISMCIHCGKELLWRGNDWWTWDADFFQYPRPQRGNAPTSPAPSTDRSFPFRPSRASADRLPPLSGH
jgi:hypothetical protein